MQPQLLTHRLKKNPYEELHVNSLEIHVAKKPQMCESHISLHAIYLITIIGTILGSTHSLLSISIMNQESDDRQDAISLYLVFLIDLGVELLFQGLLMKHYNIQKSML